MNKLLLSVLSGVLIGISFPTVLFGWHLPDLGFLGMCGLVPLFLLIHDASPKEAFRYGWLVATIYFAISFYWLYTALNRYGGISPFFSVGFILLFSGAMALYIASALSLSARFSKKWGVEPILLFPIFWTLAEWGRNYTPFGGAPWSHISMSQGGNLPLIQIADITGVYGIHFLLIWSNVYLTELFLHFRKKKVLGIVPKTIVTLLLFAGVFGYGFYRLASMKTAILKAPRLKVGLLQPNIPQDEKWDSTYQRRHQKIFNDAVGKIEEGVDLIVWPETSWHRTLTLDTPSVFPGEIGITGERGRRPHTLLGLIFKSYQNGGESYYNSAALIDAEGNILDRYHKVHLVPFGEYVPLGKLFFFLEPVAAIGNFLAGEEIRPVNFEKGNLGVLVCGEDIFPNITRVLAKKGANLLVNMTNDAWYGVSSEPYHHLVLGQFRSVETRRTTVRSTNTGATAVIEATGKISLLSPIFEESLLVYQAPLFSGETLYVRLGDWLIAACFIFLFWQTGKRYVQRNNRKA